MPDDNNQTSPADQDDLEQDLKNAAQRTKQQISQDQTLSQSLASTPQLQNLVVDVEEDLLREIITRLEKSTLTLEKAEQLAKEFLALLPIQDQKDLLQKLYALSRNNQEAQSVYLKYAKTHEDQDRQEKLRLMSQHIQQGNIEQALSIAKGEKPNA